jgi:hypothetical protein
LPKSSEIAAQRLANQRISRPSGRRPADIVARLAAVQAQEYQAAKWALGLRMGGGVTDGVIEQAVSEGHILRTHVLRPTWHFVTPSDIRWMLTLTAPNVHRAMAAYFRQNELDPGICSRAASVFERALANNRHLTRPELGAHLAASGIVAKGPRLALLTMYAELERVICSGPWRGRQLSYALVDERVPATPDRSRDEALAELARRFLASHGPATLRDFVWWSGLKTGDAKRSFEITRARPTAIDGLTYWSTAAWGPASAGPKDRRRPASRAPIVSLLPIYDEYLVAYRDRVAVPHTVPARVESTSGNAVTFQHALVINGQVAGTWRTPRPRAGGLPIDVVPLRRLSGAERRALAVEAARYGRFLGTSISMSLPH